MASTLPITTFIDHFAGFLKVSNQLRVKYMQSSLKLRTGIYHNWKKISSGHHIFSGIKRRLDSSDNSTERIVLTTFPRSSHYQITEGLSAVPSGQHRQDDSMRKLPALPS